MHNTRKITEDLVYLGADNRRLALFENIYPIERGASYNTYLLKDKKTVLFDTIDKDLAFQFMENLEFELAGRALDYIIIHHVEPDHSSSLKLVCDKYPEAKIVCNQKSLGMMKQFFDFDIDSRALVVKEGDTIELGVHTLTFVMAPMVHWPEVMVSYDLKDKILFSADGFGTFGSLNGNIFADEVDFEHDFLDDSRRYYTNIVGKYGTQVQALLKKASNLDIKIICPLHGPIWRNKIDWYIEKYQKWSTYEPEENTALIMYGSVYGHSENAAEILAGKLAERGVKNIKLYDVSKTHFSYLIAEAFRCSHIVVVAPTYNAGIFFNMETVLRGFIEHNLQNRKIAIIENGSWAPTAGGLIRKMFENSKNIEFVEPNFTIKSSLKNEQLSELYKLADKIADELTIKPAITNPMFNISYGLYVLSAKENDKDNACIINTVTQITDNPKRITIAVNKNNYTCDMIKNTLKFNVSILTEETPFSLFKRFGFQTGKDVDKFEDCKYIKRCKNGILTLDKYSNSTISANVVEYKEFDTHILFTADVVESEIISDVPSVTYSYYLNRIKPNPRPDKKKKGYVCKICGYVYEGEELPKDFICPLCKHGIEDFEPLK